MRNLNELANDLRKISDELREHANVPLPDDAKFTLVKKTVRIRHAASHIAHWAAAVVIEAEV